MTLTAQEALKEGDLNATLTSLQDQVRANPADSKLRIFLFQLLCVTGEWTRAITQLKLCAELDGLAIPMAQTYREGIICEVYREKVFRGEKDPMILGEPEPWLALLIEAQKLLAQGKPVEAAKLRDDAFDQAPTTSGTLNGTPFEWIADADMRLGPVLEVVINGRYFWLPFAQISKLVVDEPEDLRDSVWTACQLTLRNGGEIVALIPTRYAETPEKGSDAAKLSRATDWIDAGEETFVGIGQRLIATDAEETALMDIRELVLNVEPDAEEAAADG